ncbi:MAG TPA: tetratricopeptide repeat protein [Bryobacteraceae bacterium]|nr:tetratricopeptide repeat protein [Bryobacteraceae bacterium]
MLIKCVVAVVFPICLFAQTPWLGGNQDPRDDMGAARAGDRWPEFPGHSDSRKIADDSELDSESPFRVDGLTLPDLDRRQEKPISGLVSLREVEHPPSKKAIRLLVEAQRDSEAHQIAKATQELQEAVRLAPSFREAHLNLGVQYARTEKIVEAKGEFETALEIGPPDAKAYSNLAYCFIVLGQFREAESFARKALQLEPSNAPAQTLFRISSDAVKQIDRR